MTVVYKLRDGPVIRRETVHPASCHCGAVKFEVSASSPAWLILGIATAQCAEGGSHRGVRTSWWDQNHRG